jgi:hypothetical protein
MDKFVCRISKKHIIVLHLEISQYFNEELLIGRSPLHTSGQIISFFLSERKRKKTETENRTKIGLARGEVGGEEFLSFPHFSS